MLSSLLIRPDVSELFRILCNTNRTLYDGIIKTCMKGLGRENEGIVEPFGILFVGEDHLVTLGYKPKGTKLRWVKMCPQNHFRIYDDLAKKSQSSKAILINSCVIRKFWINFDFVALGRKLRKFKCPVMESYTHGEFGCHIPYKSLEQNLVHGGVVKILIFK